MIVIQQQDLGLLALKSIT